jgi:hypothetical protein
VFPVWGRDVSINEEWKWNVCGGLIGGKGSNRFCIEEPKNSGVPHCGAGCHAFKKAQLHEGFGCIPSTVDGTNACSAFLSPYVDAASLPDACMESLQNLLPPPEQWISCFAMLPAQSEMGFLEDNQDDHQEAAAATLTKASRTLSFSHTPATKGPRLTELISGPSGASVNLAERFKGGGVCGQGRPFLRGSRSSNVGGMGGR